MPDRRKISAHHHPAFVDASELIEKWRSSGNGQGELLENLVQ